MSLRPSPTESATNEPVGTIRPGNDGYYYVITSTKDGRQRWTRCTSAKLNGLKVLTLDYLRSNIGKPITLYEISSSTTWPRSKRERDMERRVFIPNGNVIQLKRKTPYIDWLITRKPSLDDRKLFFVEGEFPSEKGDMRYYGLSIDLHEELVTSNLRNTQTFVDA